MADGTNTSAHDMYIYQMHYSLSMWSLLPLTQFAGTTWSNPNRLTCDVFRILKIEHIQIDQPQYF